MTTTEKILDKMNLHNLPFKIKLLIAKIFIRTMKVGYGEDDIILYNELKLWIDTEGKPTTSNPNYWINKH